MATGQTLLDTMEVLMPELQLQSGESDVTKGLIALNRAQDLFESYAAQYPTIFGDAVGTVSTTASQEYTTFPSGLLRLDGLDMEDGSGNILYSLDPKTRRGGHFSQRGWLWSFITNSSTARPTVYWTNGTRIYWDPKPDSTYTVRWYGFQSASDISASGTFAYPDAAILALASVAVKIIKSGLDDSPQQIASIASDSFNNLLEQMSNFRRDTPPQYEYTRRHDV